MGFAWIPPAGAHDPARTTRTTPRGHLGHIRVRRSLRGGQAREMTSNQLLAFTPTPGPAWLHLLVMAFALFVLLRTLTRQR